MYWKEHLNLYYSIQFNYFKIIFIFLQFLMEIIKLCLNFFISATHKFLLNFYYKLLRKNEKYK